MATSRPVRAQPAAATEARDYRIPAGTLEDALNRFGREAGILLSFGTASTAGVSSPGLEGRHTVQSGLDMLLGGTGLQARRHVNGTYVLVPGATKAAPVDVDTLSAVKVTANQLGEITEGSGSYSPGSIATATRLVLSPRETPQSISVLTRQQMDDFQLTSIDKAMVHMPGVSIVTQDSERAVFYARGFAINTFQYDGIPSERNSGYSSGHSLSDMAIYDRVEVLKGATGLLTGTGDPGATINLIRKKPTRDFQGSVALGAGSWDNYRTQVDLGGALNAAGSVRGRLVAAHQDRHSYQEGHQRKSTVFYGIVEADLTPSTLLTIGGDYQDNQPKRSSWGGVPIYDTQGRFTQVSRRFNNGVDWSHWDQYTRTAFATLEHHFANDWVAKLQFNHQINGYDAEMSGAAAGNPDPVTGTGVRLFGPTRYEGETKGNALDVHATGPFSLAGRRHELVLGASFARRHWVNDLYLRPLGYDQSVPDFYRWSGQAVYPATWRRSTSNDEVTRENGVYATARFNPRDDLKLITGARVVNYRRADTRESGVVTPYLGAVYDLGETYSVYASYTTIFKPQAMRDEQGDALDPLRGRNVELGLKSAWFGGRLNGTVALFQLDQDNYPQPSGGLTPSGGTAYRGVDGVRTRGYELELTGRLTARWNLHAAFNHKVSRQDGEKVSTLTPENQFTLFTTYRPGGSLDRLTLGGGMRWQDKTWYDVRNPLLGTSRHTVGDYRLFDVMASYRISDRVSVALTINNLLDKRYYTLFDAFSTYTWGEPRSAMLSLTYRL